MVSKQTKKGGGLKVNGISRDFLRSGEKMGKGKDLLCEYEAWLVLLVFALLGWLELEENGRPCFCFGITRLKPSRREEGMSKIQQLKKKKKSHL